MRGLGGGSLSWTEDVRAHHFPEEIFPSSKEQAQQESFGLKEKGFNLVRSPGQFNPFELLTVIWGLGEQIRDKEPSLGGL